jgi:hypothetical protein
MERSVGHRRTRGEMRRFNLEVIFAALIEGAGERFNWRPTEAGWGIMG